MLGNVSSDAYFKVAASNTPGNEKIEIKNTVGTAADAIQLITTVGGITINAAGGEDDGEDLIVTANNFSVDADGVVTATSFSGNMSSSSLQTAEKMTISSSNADADALTISTSAGGMDITAGGNAADEDLDITATGAATEIRLTSESTEDDAIALTTSAGGITAKVPDGKDLTLGNTAGDA